MDKYFISVSIGLAAAYLFASKQFYEDKLHNLDYLSTLNTNYLFDSKIDCRNDECNLPYEKSRKYTKFYKNDKAEPLYIELFDINNFRISRLHHKNNLEKRANSFSRINIIRTSRRVRYPRIYI